MSAEYGIFQPIVESDQLINEGIKSWAKGKIDAYNKEQQRRRNHEDEEEVRKANPGANTFVRSVYSMPGGREHYGKYHPETEKDRKKLEKWQKKNDKSNATNESSIEFI